ncbi:MAG: polysaccharide export protein EpsE [Pseudomonadota bacterium]|nr:polysaccharide export protein EpsE [Pseudomonadota bacterium]
MSSLSIRGGTSALGRFLSLLLALSFFLLGSAHAQAPSKGEPVLGVGDVVKMSVYQNPDLAVEARVSETGQINIPLIGAVKVLGLTVSQAEQHIQKLLRDGGFVIKPQVTIQTVQIRSSQISILGQVGKPGRFPIDIVGSRVSEMIATAGGVVPGGADVVTLVGNRNGKPIKLDIDLPAILQSGKAELDVAVENGDIIYVDRAPTFYIYGEVQRPGQLKLERGMTLMQALAEGGGVTARGTERGIRVNRKDASGAVRVLELKPNDKIERDDVIYVRESLF